MAEYWVSHYPYQSSIHGYACQWANDGKGIKNHYLGMKFLINGKVHYGWARLKVTVARSKVNGPPTITGILTGYAYETIPGKSIIAGKTKGADDSSPQSPNASLTTTASESPTLGMLALGARTPSVWRREELVGAKSQTN